jgi:FMN reductase [NAD(P)H]
MDVKDAVIKRKSIRSYLAEQVSDADLATIISAGQWAPNAGTYTMSVVRSPDLMRRINEKTLEAMRLSGNDFLMERASLPGYLPLYGAPVVIFLSGPTDMPITQLNCAVAVENMLLQATELGLGSCFLRSPAYALNDPANVDLAREAGIPEGSQMECGMAFGYTDDEDKFRRMAREPRGTVVRID